MRNRYLKMDLKLTGNCIVQLISCFKWRREEMELGNSK